MKCIWPLIVLLLTRGWLLAAAGPDDQFIRIYDLIEQADTLKQNGQLRNAFEQYREAQTKLKKFQTAYPSWNQKAVQFRLDLLTQKLAPLLAQFEPRPEDKAGNQAVRQLKDKPAVETTNIFQPYQDQIRRLQEDKLLLQAKLEEALIARASRGSDENIDAREGAVRLHELQKENALLKLSLADRPLSGASNSRGAGGAARNSAGSSATNRLATGEPRSSKAEWQKEKTALEKEVRAYKDADGQNKLVLHSLRAQNAALQAKVSDRTKAKENENAKEKPRPGDTSDRDKVSLRKELALLRDRLTVLESQKIPFTAEEAAVIQKSLSSSAAPEAQPKGKKPRPLPAAAASLIREAGQAFNSQNYAEAEAKYQQVLRLDPENPSTLANLAAIQIEQNYLAEAETNLNRAMQKEPDDPFTLSMVGYLRLRQSKYDLAIDSLSKAAKLDPQNPEIQNYLGIALMEKGLRGPAENALRRALAVSPGYARAHHNLAFIYATSKPPLLGLANWHYDKAIGAGHAPSSELDRLLGRVKGPE